MMFFGTCNNQTLIIHYISISHRYVFNKILFACSYIIIKVFELYAKIFQASWELCAIALTTYAYMCT